MYFRSPAPTLQDFFKGFSIASATALCLHSPDQGCLAFRNQLHWRSQKGTDALYCVNGMDTTEALIEKAREKFSAGETDEIILAGQWVDAPSALFWFIKNGHTYLLMECTALDDGGYTFERTYQNFTEMCREIYVNVWHSSYVFLINNPDCTAIQVTDRSGTHEVPIAPGSQPFLYCTNGLPQEYHFLDQYGTAIS